MCCGELRSILDSYPEDRVLLGESSTPTIEDLAAVYGKNHDEIQLPMDFLFGNLNKLDAAVFKKQVDDAQLRLGGQTPVFFFSSHDHPRQWSVFGDGKNNDQIAKLTAALTLTLRGTALMYYGEELGMATMPQSDLAKIPLGPKRPRADDRDGERTPMQWTSGPTASFTTGTPWLPVESSAAQIQRCEREAESGLDLLVVRGAAQVAADTHLPQWHLRATELRQRARIRVREKAEWRRRCRGGSEHERRRAARRD